MQIEITTIVEVFTFKGFYDAHVDDYLDEKAYEADPLRYQEDRDYAAGRLLDGQREWA